MGAVPDAPFLVKDLRAAAPGLFDEVAGLVERWLAPLRARLDRGHGGFSSKQLNDPIWGTIELHPWEVALLDSPLMQRLRGVRQLGLAQYVFPGASHDRLEHACGVVGAVEAVLQALMRQTERVNRGSPVVPLPGIDTKDGQALRLAALLHDIGHGPFSHAIEPLIAHHSDDPAADWRAEVLHAGRCLAALYGLNKLPSVSEILAVLMVAAPAMAGVLGHPNLDFDWRPTPKLQERIVAAIIGAIDGPGASHLTRVISSQVDADKLDYLARDAHHTGLEIGFDTDRLLAKLEVLRVTEENLGHAAEELRSRAREAPDRSYLDIGIAASGFGSFEQMLIGRTFLYDRLYHHHKVRAADAMAQRLVLTAEEERGRPFSLGELFTPVSDDTIVRVLGTEVTHPAIAAGGPRAGALSRAILNRDLYQRAFAFRGRFIATPDGVSTNIAARDAHFRATWGPVTKALETLEGRLRLERQIHSLALRIAEVLVADGADDTVTADAIAALQGTHPETVIVDLPERKADAIRILARYPDGSLRVPEFSFNPVKWADAYELQKRTGYVFCPRDAVPIVSLAAKIAFLGEFGVVMNGDADAFIKAPVGVPAPWIASLRAAQLIDDEALAHLQRQRYRLAKVRAEHIPVPEAWEADDPDLAISIAGDLNRHIPAGLVGSDLEALKQVLRALFSFVEMWHRGTNVTGTVQNEGDLQNRLRDFLIGAGLTVEEGSVASGGKLDLFVERAILVENKFSGQVLADPLNHALDASTQGRRYAVSLSSRVVVVPLAYIPRPGELPTKPGSFRVRAISGGDDRRAEIRVLVPYGAVKPSREERVL